MKYTFEYKENQISVFQNKLIMTTKDGVENYLVTDKPKNSKKPENLFIQDLETKRALKDKPGQLYLIILWDINYLKNIS